MGVKRLAYSKESMTSHIADFIINSFLLLTSLCCIIPLLYVVLNSFSSTTTSIFPEKFTLSAYRYLFSTSSLIRSLFISVMITSVGTGISLLLTTLMAYPLANGHLIGRRVIQFLVIFTMMFSGGMIPTFFVVKATKMLNSYWSMIIPTALNAFNLIIMRNFFQTVPEELKEAARIDGQHEVMILFKIMIPLSLPVMASLALFYAVSKWNMYFDAILYISDPAKWPVQVTLRQVLFQTTSALGDSSSMAERENLSFSGEAIKSAVVIVSTLPILFIYPFVQKYFTKGVLLGAVKG